MKPMSLIFFFIILLLGILLRSEETLTQNFLFLIDQGRDLMAVKSIIYDKHITLIGPYTSLQGVFQGPLWYYLLGIPLFLANGNPVGSIVLMLVISLSAMFVSFYGMYRFVGERAALFTFFLFAISPEAIAAATYSWNPHPMWLLIPLYIFGFFKLQSNKKFNYIVWPIIGLMFHFQTALGVFIFISSIVYILIFNRKLIREKSFYLAFIFVLILFLPQIVFDFRHDFLMSKSVIKLFKGTDQGLFVGGENNQYSNIVSEHLSAFYLNFRSGFVHYGYFRLIPTTLLVFLISWIFIRKKFNPYSQKESEFVLVLYKIVGILVFLSFFYPFPIRYWFLTGFQAFYIFLFGLLLSRLWLNKITKIFVIFYIISVSLFSFYRLYVLYIIPPNDGGTAKIKGKLAAIDYIYKDAKGTPFGLFVFTPPVNTDAYDYLIWYRGEKVYNYIPYKEKKGNFYLLIEPDPGQPWSYNGWLETVIKDGEVLKTEKLPSGFIIQKRFKK